MELVSRFVAEETGAETVEYALVLGLVALAAAAAITTAGTQIKNWWSNLTNAVGTINSTT
jgi:Flp pilus assembly pilin Flp